MYTSFKAKKQLITTFLFFTIFSSAAHAKIFRVGYSGPQVAGTDYSDVSSAITAAAAGDTIQLYQNASIGSGTVNKKLVFLGFGYNLQTNTGLQAVPSTTNNATLNFASGSENSIVQGVLGNFYVGAKNVTISRSSGAIYLGYNSNIGNVAISDVSVINSSIQLYGNYGTVSNALISNCILSYAEIGNVAGLISNNIFTGHTTTNGSIVKNNIFTDNCPTGGSSVFEKNLFKTTSCTVTGSGNQFNVDMNTVFMNWNNGSYGSESNLALKAGSPAINFGTDGSGTATDAGIYGGEPGSTYKLSGIPAIPSIYQLTAPQLNANSNPYTITVSVRSNN